MYKIIAILIVLSTAACMSNPNEMAQLREENRRLRNAQADGWKPPGHPPIPSQSPTAPTVVGPGVVGGNVAPGMVGNGQVATGAIVARQQPQLYMGTVGAQSRIVTMGPKLQLVNIVCDNGSRNAWGNCQDIDRNGWDDFNTFLAFQIDGHPVVCDSRFVHPATHEVLLAPNQTCFVELGRASIVKLTMKAYRNHGTPDSIMLDAAPDRSVTKTIDIGVLTNTGLYEVGEGRFW